MGAVDRLIRDREFMSLPVEKRREIFEALLSADLTAASYGNEYIKRLRHAVETGVSPEDQPGKAPAFQRFVQGQSEAARSIIPQIRSGAWTLRELLAPEYARPSKLEAILDIPAREPGSGEFDAAQFLGNYPYAGAALAGTAAVALKLPASVIALLSAIPAALQATGAISSEQVAKGKESPGRALAAGALSGAVEMVPEVGIARPGKQLVKRLIVGPLAESAEGAAQQVIESGIGLGEVPSAKEVALAAAAEGLAGALPLSAMTLTSDLSSRRLAARPRASEGKAVRQARAAEQQARAAAQQPFEEILAAAPPSAQPVAEDVFNASPDGTIEAVAQQPAAGHRSSDIVILPGETTPGKSVVIVSPTGEVVAGDTSVRLGELLDRSLVLPGETTPGKSVVIVSPTGEVVAGDASALFGGRRDSSLVLPGETTPNRSAVIVSPTGEIVAGDTSVRLGDLFDDIITMPGEPPLALAPSAVQGGASLADLLAAARQLIGRRDPRDIDIAYQAWMGDIAPPRPQLIDDGGAGDRNVAIVSPTGEVVAGDMAAFFRNWSGGPLILPGQPTTNRDAVIVSPTGEVVAGDASARIEDLLNNISTRQAETLPEWWPIAHPRGEPLSNLLTAAAQSIGRAPREDIPIVYPEWITGGGVPPAQQVESQPAVSAPPPTPEAPPVQVVVQGAQPDQQPPAVMVVTKRGAKLVKAPQAAKTAAARSAKEKAAKGAATPPRQLAPTKKQARAEEVSAQAPEVAVPPPPKAKAPAVVEAPRAAAPEPAPKAPLAGPEVGAGPAVGPVAAARAKRAAGKTPAAKAKAKAAPPAETRQPAVEAAPPPAKAKAARKAATGVTAPAAPVTPTPQEAAIPAAPPPAASGGTPTPAAAARPATPSVPTKRPAKEPAAVPPPTARAVGGEGEAGGTVAPAAQEAHDPILQRLSKITETAVSALRDYQNDPKKIKPVFERLHAMLHAAGNRSATRSHLANRIREVSRVADEAWRNTGAAGVGRDAEAIELLGLLHQIESDGDVIGASWALAKPADTERKKVDRNFAARRILRKHQVYSTAMEEARKKLELEGQATPSELAGPVQPDATETREPVKTATRTYKHLSIENLEGMEGLEIIREASRQVMDAVHRVKDGQEFDELVGEYSSLLFQGGSKYSKHPPPAGVYKARAAAWQLRDSPAKATKKIVHDIADGLANDKPQVVDTALLALSTAETDKIVTDFRLELAKAAETMKGVGFQNVHIAYETLSVESTLPNGVKFKVMLVPGFSAQYSVEALRRSIPTFVLRNMAARTGYTQEQVLRQLAASQSFVVGSSTVVPEGHLIYINALAAKKKGLDKTIVHELTHALWDSFLTNDERAAIMKTIGGPEELAKLAERDVRLWPGPFRSAIASLTNALKRFYKVLFNYPDIERLLRELASGARMRRDAEAAAKKQKTSFAVDQEAIARFVAKVMSEKPITSKEDLVKALDRMVEVSIKEGAGGDWYSDDIEEAIDIISDAYGWTELKEDRNRTIFKYILGVTSAMSSPNSNMASAISSYSYLRKTGRLTGKFPVGGREVSTSPASAQKIETLRRFLEYFNWDVEAAKRFTLSFVPFEEAQRVYRAMYSEDAKLKVPVKDGLVFGGHVFGRKLGSFTANLLKFYRMLTIDRWGARTYLRLHGLFRKSERLTDEEWDRFGEAIEEVASSRGLTIAQTQAYLWFYEINLWRALGATVSASYMSGAASYAIRAIGGDLKMSGEVVGRPEFREAVGVPELPKEKLEALRGVGRVGKDVSGDVAADLESASPEDLKRFVASAVEVLWKQKKPVNIADVPVAARLLSTRAGEVLSVAAGADVDSSRWRVLSTESNGDELKGIFPEADLRAADKIGSAFHVLPIYIDPVGARVGDIQGVAVPLPMGDRELMVPVVFTTASQPAHFVVAHEIAEGMIEAASPDEMVVEMAVGGAAEAIQWAERRGVKSTLPSRELLADVIALGMLDGTMWSEVARQIDDPQLRGEVMSAASSVVTAAKRAASEVPEAGVNADLDAIAGLIAERIASGGGISEAILTPAGVEGEGRAMSRAPPKKVRAPTLDELLDYVDKELDIPVRVGLADKSAAFEVGERSARVSQIDTADRIAALVAGELARTRGRIDQDDIVAVADWLDGRGPQPLIVGSLPADLNRKLRKLADMLQAHRAQSALERGRQMIAKKPGLLEALRKLSPRDAFRRARLEWVSAYEPIERLVRNVQYSGPPSSDPLIFARAFVGNAPGFIHNAAVGDGIFSINGRKICDSLMELISPALEGAGNAEKVANELMLYAVARRVQDVYQSDLRKAMDEVDARELAAARANERRAKLKQKPKPFNRAKVEEQVKRNVIRHLGMDPATAGEIVEHFKGRPGFEEAVHGITVWNRGILKFIEELGGIKPNTVAKIWRSGQVYVPFSRKIRDIARDVYSARTTHGSAYIKRLTGHNAPIRDIFEASITRGQELVNAGIKAALLRRVVDAAASSPEGRRFVQIVTPGQTAMHLKVRNITKSLRMLGLEVSRDMEGEPILAFIDRVDPPDSIPTAIPYDDWSRGGGRVFLDIVDEKLYRALMSNPEQAMSGIWWGLFRTAAKLQRLGATGLNPSFGMLMTPIRDQWQALLYTKVGGVPFFKFLSNAVSGKTTGFDWYGGRLTTFFGLDAKTTKALRDEVVRGAARKWKVLTNIKHPIDAAMDLLGYFERVTRRAEYERAYNDAISRGYSERDAIVSALYQAKDITLNFTEAGVKGRALNMITTFYNAGVQDLSKLLRTMRERPLEFMLRGFLSITVPMMALWFINRDKEWYKEAPLWEKLLFMHVEVGDTVLRIPGPFTLFFLFGSVPVTLVDAAYRNDPGMVEKAIPAVIDTVMPPVVPTLLSAIFNTASNWDPFRDRPIVPRGLQQVEPEEQFTERTHQFYRWLGQQLGVSPMKLEYFINYVTGGLPRVFAASKEVTEAADLPVVGRIFMREERAGESVDRFYRELREAEAVAATIRKMAKEKRVEEAVEMAMTYRQMLGIPSRNRDRVQRFLSRRRLDTSTLFPRLTAMREAERVISRFRGHEDTYAATVLAARVLEVVGKNDGEDATTEGPRLRTVARSAVRKARRELEKELRSKGTPPR